MKSLDSLGVIKRDQSITPFAPNKIMDAITSSRSRTISVEDIQDQVEFL